MEKCKKERKMKVYGVVTVSRDRWGNNKKLTTVPQIRLQGLWLEQFGFQPGMDVKVECEEGRIVIKKNE